MRYGKWLLMLSLVGLFECPALCQSWSSAATSGELKVVWSRNADLYTFLVNSPQMQGGHYGVLGWTLEPFNIPAPVEVTCPDGWQWGSQGGWNYFELAKSNQKYIVDGPALEPGQTLTFLYKVGTNTQPVNPGGPSDGSMGFLCHVGAVSGQLRGCWLPVPTQYGDTWHDAAQTVPSGPAIPEPSALFLTGTTFLGLMLFRVKRARV